MAQILVATALLLTTAMGAGQQAAVDADTVARKAFERNQGNTSYSELSMTLVNGYGEERTRSLVIATRRYGEVTKEYTRFTSPRDIAGTGFLSWEHEARADDQFLFMPALGRVRRISGKQRDRRFVGTDFTYEDLARLKATTHTHRILGHEKIRGQQCWMLESTPKEESESQYGKIVRWVANDTYLDWRIDYFDKKGKLAKRFIVNNAEEVDGIWTVMSSEMHDLRERHRTRLEVKKVEYNKDVEDRTFTKQNLKNPE